MQYTVTMKWCSGCDKDKPDEKFAWRKFGVSRHSRCKACQRKASKAHYENNKEAYKAKSNFSRPALIARGRKFIADYLDVHPCVDCGETDINVLQFDHVIPLANYRAPRVTGLVEHSIARIQQEIDKCEVRCANCHVRRTRTMNGTLLR